MIIGFSGLDGCGKSTIIKLISDEIQHNEELKNAEVVWTRVGYTPFMNLLKSLARKMSGNKLPKAGRSEERTKAFKNPWVQQIWITLALLELIWIFAIKIRLKSTHKTVLLDRQIVDSIIDLQVLFGNDIIQSRKYGFLIKTLKVLSIRIQKVGLYIDIETSDYRCSIKHEPFPDLPEEKVIRYELYQEAFNNNVFDVVLDGKQQPQFSVQKILSSLNIKK